MLEFKIGSTLTLNSDNFDEICQNMAFAYFDTLKQVFDRGKKMLEVESASFNKPY